MNRPEFEVMHFDKDVIVTSGNGCSGECGVHTCNAECANYDPANCPVDDTKKAI